MIINTGRILVIDSMCVLPYGHNVPALNYYHSYLKQFYTNVEIICCKDLPLASHTKHFHRRLGYYYHDFVPLEPSKRNSDTNPPVPRHLPHFDYEKMALDDFDTILKDFSVTRGDTLFLPSADFYGLVGLIKAIEHLPCEKRPRLLLRFIGVMETATRSYAQPLDVIVRLLRNAMDSGITLNISAEVPAYADYLSEQLGVTVAACPWPETGGQMPIKQDGPFTVYCPGSARLDKGFLNLFDIIFRVRRQNSGLAIRFVTQTLSYRDAKHHDKYISQLYAIPGVDLLPSSISPQEMNYQYLNCHATLLPYDTTTYQYRGSAVMMEAAFFGRPIFGYNGSGFANQISYYGLGWLSDDNEGIAESIINVGHMDRAQLQLKASQARSRFALDVESANRRWFL